MNPEKEVQPGNALSTVGKHPPSPRERPSRAPLCEIFIILFFSPFNLPFIFYFSFFYSLFFFLSTTLLPRYFSMGVRDAARHPAPWTGINHSHVEHMWSFAARRFGGTFSASQVPSMCARLADTGG